MINNSNYPQLLVSTLLALSLAKQSRWNPVKDKRSPDGFGFSGRHRPSHRTSHRTSHGGGRSASSGYGAPPAPAPAQAVVVAAAAPAQAGYGQPRAPACRTEYEEECTTVNEEKCETVQDNVCTASTKQQVTTPCLTHLERERYDCMLSSVPDSLGHQV